MGVSEHTPTTEHVESVYGRVSDAHGIPVQSEARRAEFRRWLAAHDAERDFEIRKQADIIALLREDEAELHRIRASVVAEEPEAETWIFWGSETDTGAIVRQFRGERYASHRRIIKAGPWVPVGQGDDDA